MMSEKNPCFVAWEERIICNERGSRVVHFYLKDESGESILAVVGTERSIRHMMYVVSDELVQVYGITSACTKWRARREVVDWLNSLVSKHGSPSCDSNSQMNDAAEALKSLRVMTNGLSTDETCFPDPMVPRKLKSQVSEIEWSGVAWLCAKQLKHYPVFRRNGTTIAVHSFVFIMAEEESHYLGYLEDMYEDKKGQKKVKVRWFHNNQEVKGGICQLNVHPKEVFITPHVQVISAECVDGPATVLTPKHYEKCLAVVTDSTSRIHMCWRQFKNNKVKPFTLTKLRGYSTQSILSCLGDSFVSKQKGKCNILIKEDGEDFTRDGRVRVGAKRNAIENGFHATGIQKMKHEAIYPKLKLRLSKKTMSNFIEPQIPCPISFGVDDKIELLCQDSGIRGCWFRCKILRASPKNLKVQYQDLQDVDGSCSLEEWVPASRVADPDKLGMRCSGRLTVRPYPPEDSSNCTFEGGAPVDVWWSDGWWEGVLTGVKIPENENVQVYSPGEDKFLFIEKKNVRASRDWIGNRWVNIKPRPDILSCVSAKVSLGMKISNCSTVNETFKLDTVKEDEQESPALRSSDEPLENVTVVNSMTGPCISDVDENGNAATGREDMMVLEEDLGTVKQKCQAEAMQIDN